MLIWLQSNEKLSILFLFYSIVDQDNWSFKFGVDSTNYAS